MKDEKQFKPVVLGADGLRVSGPRVDGSMSVTLVVGEYEQKKVARLLMLPKDRMLKITIEVD